MASYRKQLSLLKPGLSVSVSVNAKREVKVHPDRDTIMSSLTITPPGSPPGALADDHQTHDPQTHDPQTTDQQIQAQKLIVANLLTPNASPIHETDAYSLTKASCVYHATPVVKSPPRQPPVQPRAVITACASVPVKSLTSKKVQGFVHPNIVDEAICDIFRKIDTNVRTVYPQVPTHRQAVVDRIPIVVPADMEAFEKNQGFVAKPCPQCMQLPGPVFDMDCADSCHRPSTPPNLTVNDYRSAMEDVCKYDMPTLVRAREVADLAMWSKREEYSRKSFLQSILDVTPDLMDSDGCDESGYDTPDEGYAVQSSALEARLRRRMKKAKRRKRESIDAHNKHVSQANNSELFAVLLEDVKPRIIVTSNKNSSDMRVPDLKIHTYIPTDHNSYCAPAKSPKPAPHVELGMDGIVVVKEPNGRLNTTVPGSLPTDSTTPRKILSQVGQRKRTSMPSPNTSLNFKRSKRSPHGKEEPDCDPESRAMVAEKKEKHKQSERVRRNKSSLLIKSLQSYIANTCGKNYFKCKNRSENPSKQATVETTVARYMELDNANNNALLSMNSTFTSAVEMLKGLQRRTHSGDQFRTLSQAMKAEADALKVQISERLQLAQTYGK